MNKKIVFGEIKMFDLVSVVFRMFLGAINGVTGPSYRPLGHNTSEVENRESQNLYTPVLSSHNAGVVVACDEVLKYL